MGEKKRKKKNQFPLRLNILFFVVFLLFSALILRLGFVQIVYGDDYKRELEKKEDIIISTQVPRGEMYDRNGHNIVSNKAKNAITYTNWDVKAKDMQNTAEKLARLIKMDTEDDLKKITERDRIDYWILLHEKKAKAKVTKKEDAELQETYKNDSKKYQKAYNELLRSRITKEEINSFSKFELETLAIYRAFNSGYYYTPQIVKNNGVTDEEFARVSEHLAELKGVDTTKDWDRTYAYGSTLKTVLGNVSSSQRGVPAEEKDSYLAKGYSMNDRVGLSYLENQYEDILKGQKKKIKYIKDKTGEIVDSKALTDGESGKDLVLTIDMKLQLEVEKIIEEELKRTKRGYAGTYLLDRAFVVLMDPKTGEILTMAGKMLGKDDNGNQQVQDFALGNITTSYNVGSTVKGAMVLTGYKEGVIKPYSVIHDEVMQVKGSPPFKSWKTMGYINDLTALQQSSNVYMAKTAIAIGKGHYSYGQPLDTRTSEAMSTIRNSFGEFGLGVRTGIDLPNEMVGFKGQDTQTPGNLMFLSIGQYDTYTNMQLAQYASTIANGGYRIQPHMVKEIRDPSLGEEELGGMVQEIQPKVLNKVDLEPGWIEQVQKGFRMVMTSGTGKVFAGASYQPAGKTGTAQAFYDGPLRSNYSAPPQVMNLSLITYAPSENPEVAMAVLVPWAYTTNSGPSPNLTIGKRVLDKYFEMKKEETAK
ncbi:penicillin-binding protein [Niallia nealsonii]|uniref:serine-type D-Ala-D-Ala carboxypeptidase n=2 Tax=Niallia nealsonii TaxID=115979 RepID=A0A2N0Z896_9BACI|nr:penicillin-binding protein 2 [Niallia nealsonii]PKG25746.1 penicillin-binding protein [Niallia nealsonii]